MIHPTAHVHTDRVGPNTKIWQFVVVLEGTVIGDHCNINCLCGIENNVVLGDHVTLKSFVGIGEGTRIGDHVFVGPHASFINDRTPRSKNYLDQYPTTTIENWASIGAGAVIFPGIRVGQYALVGSGSIVNKDVPRHGMVVGNPARLIGWVDTKGQRLVQDGDLFRGPTGESYRMGEHGMVPA